MWERRVIDWAKHSLSLTFSDADINQHNKIFHKLEPTTDSILTHQEWMFVKAHNGVIVNHLRHGKNATLKLINEPIELGKRWWQCKSAYNKSYTSLNGYSQISVTQLYIIKEKSDSLAPVETKLVIWYDCRSVMNKMIINKTIPQEFSHKC